LLAPLNLLFLLLLSLTTEFTKITSKTALGFVVMGFIGFFVKLIFIVSLEERFGFFRFWVPSLCRPGARGPTLSLPLER
jgi:hypothetical protein